MKITSAEISPRNKDQRRIFLDHIFSFTMPEEVYVRTHFYEKEEISQAEVDELRNKSIRQVVREHAMRLLTVRDRTGKGLVERLKQAGYDEDIAMVVTEDMKTVGYIDDRRYAQRYISEQLRSKAISRKAIRFTLQTKGVDKDIIEEVLAEFEQDDEDMAVRGLKKKFGKYDLSDPTIEQKAIGYLMHRGFSYESVQRALQRSKDH